MQEEKINNPISGYTMLLVMLVLIALTILTFVTLKAPIAIGLIMSNILIAKGFFFINPNGSRVLVLFGDYKGTVKKNGFFWTTL